MNYIVIGQLLVCLLCAGIETLGGEPGEVLRFEGRTPAEWARLQRRDFATFQNAVDSLGVAAAGDWARLLAPGHADEEKLAAIDALRTSLREDGMRSTRISSEKFAVPALLPLLREDRAFVRARAMKALESIGSPARDAVPELLRIFRNTDDPDAARFSLRECAAGALGAIATPPDQIVPALVEGLRDESPKVCRASARALGTMGWNATAGICPLELAAAAAESDSEFRQVAESALAAIRRPPPPRIGDSLPPLELPPLDASAKVRLDSLKGSIVVIDFWSTTCPPCQPAMTHLQELSQKHSEWRNKVIFVGISRDESPTIAQQHAIRKGWTGIRLLSDHDGRVQDHFRAVLPTLVLVNQSGRIVWRGHPTDIDVEDEIERLLKPEGE